MDYPVLIVKLASGEEIVSKVHEEGTTLVLIKPRQFILRDDGKGGVVGGLAEFMPIAKGQVVNLVQRPIAMAEPNDDLKNSYLRLIGDVVIETPNKSIIIPK
jgi:hypothetical protein